VSGVLAPANGAGGNSNVTRTTVTIQSWVNPRTKVGPTFVVKADSLDSSEVSYGPFSVGDTNRVGGFDRVKVTICDFDDLTGAMVQPCAVHNVDNPNH